MRNAAARCSALVLSLAGVLAALPCVAPAAESPTGTLLVSVTESRHQRAIPFASVSVRDEKRGALIDTDGWGWLPKLPAGRHFVQVTFLGYVPFRDSVLVHAQATDTLRVVLREVVVREESPYQLLPTRPVGGDTTYRLLPTTPRRRPPAVPAATAKQ